MKKSETPAKRINLVSVKLVREGSILYKTRNISTSGDAAGIGRQFLEDLDREQVMLLCLDNRNQPTSINVVSIGTNNSSLIHPREIFKIAVLSNAASIILYHNHPSGETQPSQEDIEVSKRIEKAGKLMGIELLDHLIIGSENRYCSLKEQGMF